MPVSKKSLLWALFDGFHYIILRHKWRACLKKIGPLASNFLVPEPNDVELENQQVSRFAIGKWDFSNFGWPPKLNQSR